MTFLITESRETVVLKKPFGLRISKRDLRVTRVEPRGASIGRVGVGDKIVAINGVKLNNIHELNEQLAKPAKVQIRLEPFPDMDLGQELGLSVKYDNKERLQVASVVPGTLASVHLRPGDIIREVNGHHIASKTMLAFWIRQGFHSDNQIVLLIETGVEADTHIEMPEDVQNIAQRQVQGIHETDKKENTIYCGSTQNLAHRVFKMHICLSIS
ncbi:unnamed protein product [Gongylonema pulchrum]|uniref:PDZ domain-containing protein n=1 Tax=Gongylonema pulchrum TaxID=637853 RepID=A0A183E826_9BILA|nr:unnamed protein product [Gongylonema pulchrum]